MAFARARAVRPLQAALRPRAAAGSRTPLARLTQAGQRRWQSSGHGDPIPSSDIPWAAGALVTSVVGSWYLWPSKHSADAGHHGEHAEHAEEEHEEKDAPEEEAPAGDAKPEEGEGGDAKEEPKKEEGSDEKKEEPKESEAKPKESEDKPKEEGKSDDDAEAKDGDDKKDTPAPKEDEAPPGDDSKKSTYASNPAGKDAPQFKGKMKEGAAGHSHTAKSEPSPESKGTMKKRLDSGYQTDLGSGEHFGDAATAKEIDKSKQGDISTKQAGLSTTATRHSTNIGEDPSKSKKGEGVPETAKSMGTVDPSRPAR